MDYRKEFEKEEGICLWDSSKNSNAELERLNACVDETFASKYVLRFSEGEHIQGKDKTYGVYDTQNESYVTENKSSHCNLVGNLPYGSKTKVYIKNVEGNNLLCTKTLSNGNEKGTVRFSRDCIIAVSPEPTKGLEKWMIPVLENKDKIRDIFQNNDFYDNRITMYEAIASIPKELYNTHAEEVAQKFGVSLQKEQETKPRTVIVDMGGKPNKPHRDRPKNNTL